MVATAPESVADLPECGVVVFGGTGDLALRKLPPALYHRETEHQLPDSTRIVGVSRSELDDEAYRNLVAEATAEHVDETDPEAVARLLARLHHLTLDATGPEGW